MRVKMISVVVFRVKNANQKNLVRLLERLNFYWLTVFEIYNLVTR